MTGSRGRRTRISRSADFDRVYRSGRSYANRLMVVHAFPRGDSEPSRLGLSVSRKVGGAVERNRAKRLIREAFSEQLPDLAVGFDIVVVARAAESGSTWDRSLAEVSGQLGELLSEAGVTAIDGEPDVAGGQG